MQLVTYISFYRCVINQRCGANNYQYTPPLIHLWVVLWTNYLMYQRNVMSLKSSSLCKVVKGQTDTSSFLHSYDEFLQSSGRAHNCMRHLPTKVKIPSTTIPRKLNLSPFTNNYSKVTTMKRSNSIQNGLRRRLSSVLILLLC